MQSDGAKKKSLSKRKLMPSDESLTAEWRAQYDSKHGKSLNTASIVRNFPSLEENKTPAMCSTSYSRGRKIDTPPNPTGQINKRSEDRDPTTLAFCFSRFFVLFCAFCRPHRDIAFSLMCVKARFWSHSFRLPLCTIPRSTVYYRICVSILFPSVIIYCRYHNNPTLYLRSRCMLGRVVSTKML